MANIIHMRDRSPTLRRLTRKPQEAGVQPGINGAEILLFTGVRYERYTTENAPENPTQSGTRRARKR